MKKEEAAMDKALRDKIAALQTRDDETGDGRVDLADLKHQLDRVEAQLELQDWQNRRLLRNQRLRMLMNGAVLAVVCLLAVVLFLYTRAAYDKILQASAQVNEIAATLQNSLSTLDSEQLDQMMQTLPDIMDRLASIDVDALNAVLAELPGVLDSVQQLQTDMEQLRSWLGGLGTLFGGG